MTKGRLLTTPEPTETEEKTTAQLEDEKQPAAMNVSSSMYDLAETDDRPAIEQRVAKGVLFGDDKNTEQATAKDTTGPKNFQIDADFATEMHERTKKELAERKAKEKEAAEEEQKKRAERKEEIAKKLQESQTLDDTELRDRIKEEIAAENNNQLYPDAKPITQEIEDELWRSRTEKGAQIAGRAKIEDVEDADLKQAIIAAFIIQIISTIIMVCGIFASLGSRILDFMVFNVICSVAIAYTVLALHRAADKTKLRRVPSDQGQQFVFATFIPGFLLRLIFIGLFSQIPITGGFIGPILGAAIGASIHYSFINRYKIYVSIKSTLINTLIYIVFLTITTATAANGTHMAAVALVFAILSVLEFFFGDRAAMLLALYTTK
ncbi:MAG: hypothetical protein K5837_02140 [Candidatus Saccharibacteria bacterium]|nr:hypothetical protein [Candidatus Saccharibacteria bacterium]